MSWFDFIALWIGYGVIACVVILVGMMVYLGLNNRGQLRGDYSGYDYYGSSPCSCEWETKDVCCICGRIKGAETGDWHFAQPTKGDEHGADRQRSLNHTCSSWSWKVKTNNPDARAD